MATVRNSRSMLEAVPGKPARWHIVEAGTGRRLGDLYLFAIGRSEEWAGYYLRGGTLHMAALHTGPLARLRCVLAVEDMIEGLDARDRRNAAMGPRNAMAGVTPEEILADWTPNPEGG